MKALSIKQPWAWAICNLPDPFKKCFENRTWNTKFRGEFLVHASKGFDAVGYERMCGYLKELGYKGNMPTKKEFVYGAFIGKTELIDVVEQSENIWFEGEYGFVLKNTVAFEEPIPYKGQLNFFNVDDEILEMESVHMSKLEYLYGVKSACWKHLNYIEAFELKNILANKVLSQINDTHYMHRDDKRKREVMRAIKYNLKRIEE